MILSFNVLYYKKNSGHSFLMRSWSVQIQHRFPSPQAFHVKVFIAPDKFDLQSLLINLSKLEALVQPLCQPASWIFHPPILPFHYIPSLYTVPGVENLPSQSNILEASLARFHLPPPFLDSNMLFSRGSLFVGLTIELFPFTPIGLVLLAWFGGCPCEGTWPIIPSFIFPSTRSF